MVEKITNGKLSELKRTISLKTQGDEKVALEIVTTDSGQAAMEDLRRIFQELDAYQAAQVGVVGGVIRKTIRTSRLINVTLSFLALVVVTGLIYFLRKSVRDGLLMEQSLVESNRSLEKTKELFAEVISVQNELASSRLDVEATLNKVVHLSQELTKSDGAIIEKLDMESGDLVYSYTPGAAQNFIGLRVKAANSFSGLCLREQKPIMCLDSEIDDRVDREACRKVNLRSMIVVPLFYGDELVGVLKNYSKVPNYYGDEVFKALSLVSVMLASSLGQAKEYERLLHENQSKNPSAA